MFIPADLSGEVRNNGFYEKFKYRYWGYAKIPSNPQDSSMNSRRDFGEGQGINPISERPLRPRYLCFLNGANGVSVEKVEDWISRQGIESDMNYIFVAYTNKQFCQDEEKDMDALHLIAQRAARAAGVPAYWIGCSCMPDEDQMTEDIHRISDVVRGAHSLVIIVGPPPGNNECEIGMEGMLKQWGTRMWTFPEVLLNID
jgi:hypothetical protein